MQLFLKLAIKKCILASRLDPFKSRHLRFSYFIELNLFLNWTYLTRTGTVIASAVQTQVGHNSIIRFNITILIILNIDIKIVRVQLYERCPHMMISNSEIILFRFKRFTGNAMVNVEAFKIHDNFQILVLLSFKVFFFFFI